MVYLGLSKSFEAKYHGAAIEGFHEYLTENESLFKDKEGPAYYARFCSIVQSSGTGKSRLLTEANVLHLALFLAADTNASYTRRISWYFI